MRYAKLETKKSVDGGVTVFLKIDTKGAQKFQVQLNGTLVAFKMKFKTYYNVYNLYLHKYVLLYEMASN